MEEEEGNGEATPPLEPRRHELLAAAVGEDSTPAAAVSTHMNFEGRREFFFQAEDGIRDATVTGVQTCALPISRVGILRYLLRYLTPFKVP